MADTTDRFSRRLNSRELVLSMFSLSSLRLGLSLRLRGSERPRPPYHLPHNLGHQRPRPQSIFARLSLRSSLSSITLTNLKIAKMTLRVLVPIFFSVTFLVSSAVVIIYTFVLKSRLPAMLVVGLAIAFVSIAVLALGLWLWLLSIKRGQRGKYDRVKTSVIERDVVEDVERGGQVELTRTDNIGEVDSREVKYEAQEEQHGCECNKNSKGETKANHGNGHGKFALGMANGENKAKVQGAETHDHALKTRTAQPQCSSCCELKINRDADKIRDRGESKQVPKTYHLAEPTAANSSINSAAKANVGRKGESPHGKEEIEATERFRPAEESKTHIKRLKDIPQMGSLILSKSDSSNGDLSPHTRQTLSGKEPQIKDKDEQTKAPNPISKGHITRSGKQKDLQSVTCPSLLPPLAPGPQSPLLKPEVVKCLPNVYQGSVAKQESGDASSKPTQPRHIGVVHGGVLDPSPVSLKPKKPSNIPSLHRTSCSSRSERQDQCRKQISDHSQQGVSQKQKCQSNNPKCPSEQSLAPRPFEGIIGRVHRPRVVSVPGKLTQARNRAPLAPGITSHLAPRKGLGSVPETAESSGELTNPPIPAKRLAEGAAALHNTNLLSSVKSQTNPQTTAELKQQDTAATSHQHQNSSNQQMTESKGGSPSQSILRTISSLSQHRMSLRPDCDPRGPFRLGRRTTTPRIQEDAAQVAPTAPTNQYPYHAHHEHLQFNFQQQFPSQAPVPVPPPVPEQLTTVLKHGSSKARARSYSYPHGQPYSASHSRSHLHHFYRRRRSLRRILPRLSLKIPGRSAPSNHSVPSLLPAATFPPLYAQRHLVPQEHLFRQNIFQAPPPLSRLYPSHPQHPRLIALTSTATHNSRGLDSSENDRRESFQLEATSPRTVVPAQRQESERERQPTAQHHATVEGTNPSGSAGAGATNAKDAK
ncbi:hypothetical protein L228DRAFT_26998 [Xylona heveae TC161]|uniref:Uncharacterized protein n=1 Tax=Xylona heveae (strain CBS 132557 / TC161) TaxID=1328760 RepID=A0A165AFH0_XYLHT|nr:hypothetical protein L228DRAFT_26998 [Xylona heveae TC161]KZF20391.1 hypothetical protein L228DRAFT_26998 [Xylona heveae TC161]